MPTNKPSKSEDEYFAREEAERLTEQRRRAREAAEAAARQAHFMKCPKDGHDLVQEKFHGVTVDRCPHCQGIFLGADEIAALAAQQDVTLLGREVRDMFAALRAPRAEPE
jgi:hypothetical protein